MQSETMFTVKVYLKHHILPSYQLTFHSEESTDKFVDYVNNDVDYVRIGEEVIERRKIRKLVITHA